MVNLVSEEEAQTKETVEISESAPEVEVITEADVGSVEEILSQGSDLPDLSPLENEKVIARVLSFHNAVLKIKDVDFYRNAGRAAYINYTVGPRKSIVGLHFSKTKSRITMHTTDGKKATGDVSIKIDESGLSMDDESITQKAVIALVKKYHSDRGWI